MSRFNSHTVKASLASALPIMAGYVVLGLPCGILCAQAGLSPLQTLLMSVFLYSGAGQFMIPNMWLAGASPIAIITSVSLVNTRHILYGASLSQHCGEGRKRLSLLFAATVTDESFGVNLAQWGRRQEEPKWSLENATLVNLFSQVSWTVATVVGAIIGAIFSVPVALASFAMTSIFICLLFMQKATLPNVVAALFAVGGVVVCKLVGLTGPAILIGAVVGIAAGMTVFALKERGGVR